jgi:hypothetical protein
MHQAKQGQSPLRALDQAWQAQPQDLPTALAYARAVFELGLNEGDLRWFGSAKAALAPWWSAEELPAEGFFLRGLIKQGFHDFTGGLADINRAIALAPRRTELWSWRFALHLLLGDMAAAEQDTAEIERLFGQEEADVHRAVLRYRSGEAPSAVRLLSQALQSPSYQNDAAQDWLSFHLGEAHRVAGQADQALAVWAARLKRNEDAHLLRLSMAELLNQQGRYAQAKATAMRGRDAASLSDALLMQALLAARGLQDADEAELAGLMAARLDAQALRQERLIERPQLIHLITYGQDMAAGLALSQENWRTQKEPPDAVLFAQAALALGQARAAEPVVVWAEQTAYRDPQLTPLIQQLKAHPSWAKAGS